MKITSIPIPTSRPYDVEIASGLLACLGEKAANLTPGRRAALVSDSAVAPLYGQRAQAALEEAGFFVCTPENTQAMAWILPQTGRRA